KTMTNNNVHFTFELGLTGHVARAYPAPAASVDPAVFHDAALYQHFWRIEVGQHLAFLVGARDDRSADDAFVAWYPDGALHPTPGRSIPDVVLDAARNAYLYLAKRGRR